MRRARGTAEGVKPRLYLETTIPSYLVARPSRDIRLLADQDITRRWWEKCRGDYEVFVSELVLEEAARGDGEMAAARQAVLAAIPQLSQTPEADALAASILRLEIIPPRVSADAEHVALAAVHGMDYLATWNCKHIANPRNRDRLEAVCEAAGFRCPNICTPYVLLGN